MEQQGYSYDDLVKMGATPAPTASSAGVSYEDLVKAGAKPATLVGPAGPAPTQSQADADYERAHPTMAGFRAAFDTMRHPLAAATEMAHAIVNTAPEAKTMSTPATDALVGGAIPGGAGTETMGAADAISNSPVAQGAKAAVQALRDRVISPISSALRLPSTESAGAKFQQVMDAARDVPIDTSTAQTAVQRAQELRAAGSTMPKVMNDFSKTTQPIQVGDAQVTPPPLTYEQGRDFASNAGALSTRETTAMNSKMQRQVTQFSMALKDANRQAATQVGMGELYDQAMKEYRQAKTLEDAAEVLKKYGVKAAAAAGLGAAGTAGYSIYRDLTKP